MFAASCPAGLSPELSRRVFGRWLRRLHTQARDRYGYHWTFPAGACFTVEMIDPDTLLDQLERIIATTPCFGQSYGSDPAPGDPVGVDPSRPAGRVR